MTPSPINILYVGNRLSGHGSTPTNIDTLGPQLEQEGYNLYYTSDKLNRFRRFTDMLSSIFRHAKQAKIVLIDTYSTDAFYFAWASSLLCRALHVPYIPILHGGNLPQRISGSPILSRQLFGKSYTNIVISGYLKQCLDKGGFKSLLIPNNIDLSAYPFLHRTHLAPNLLWVRAFHKTYNPTMAIDVLALVLLHYPNARLTMVGPEKDGSMAECKQLAEKHGITNNIKFTGRLSKEDWISLAAHHDIFINTTSFDNLPVSLIEAMALGFPVVSTNVGGIPFLVEDKIEGILTSPGDVHEMSATILALLNDQEKAGSISLAARQKAEQFDWLFIRQKWNALFSALAN